MFEHFSNFLQELAPYVVVVGSFARGQENDTSDIDCYLRNRPPAEVDPESGDNETYMPEVLALIEKYGYFTSSVIVGHIAVERQAGVPRMVEVSSHYRIRRSEQVSVRKIYGVPFLCAPDDKNALADELYEALDWNDELCEMELKYPLPSYAEISHNIS